MIFKVKKCTDSICFSKFGWKYPVKEHSLPVKFIWMVINSYPVALWDNKINLVIGFSKIMVIDALSEVVRPKHTLKTGIKKWKNS